MDFVYIITHLTSSNKFLNIPTWVPHSVVARGRKRSESKRVYLSQLTWLHPTVPETLWPWDVGHRTHTALLLAHRGPVKGLVWLTLPCRREKRKPHYVGPFFVIPARPIIPLNLVEHHMGGSGLGEAETWGTRCQRNGCVMCLFVETWWRG